MFKRVVQKNVNDGLREVIFSEIQYNMLPSIYHDIRTVDCDRIIISNTNLKKFVLPSEFKCSEIKIEYCDFSGSIIDFSKLSENLKAISFYQTYGLSLVGTTKLAALRVIKSNFRSFPKLGEGLYHFSTGNTNTFDNKIDHLVKEFPESLSSLMIGMDGSSWYPKLKKKSMDFIHIDSVFNVKDLCFMSDVVSCENLTVEQYEGSLRGIPVANSWRINSINTEEYNNYKWMDLALKESGFKNFHNIKDNDEKWDTILSKYPSAITLACTKNWSNYLRDKYQGIEYGNEFGLL